MSLSVVQCAIRREKIIILMSNRYLFDNVGGVVEYPVGDELIAD